MEPLIGSVSVMIILVRGWQLLARRGAAKGRGFLLRHLVGALGGFVAGFFALGVAVAGGIATWVVLGVAVALLVVGRDHKTTAPDAGGTPNKVASETAFLRGLAAHPSGTDRDHGPVRPVGISQADGQPRKKRPQDRRAAAIDEWRSDLTTVWAGNSAPVEFTYVNSRGERTRRRVDVDEVLQDGRHGLYISGYCHARGETRTFSVYRIATMIKIGHERVDVYDWLERLTDGVVP